MTTLSSLVIARQAATIAQVDQALACQVVKGGDLGTCLLESGALTEEILLPLVGEAYGLLPLNPGPLPTPPRQVLELVPRPVVLRYLLYPFRERDGELHVAVVEPLPQAVEDDLAFALGAQLRQFAATAVRIREAIARDYGQPLDRRFLRLLAKLESLPDPSPSIVPPPPNHGGAVDNGKPVEERFPRKRTWPGMLAAIPDPKAFAPAAPPAVDELTPSVSELAPTPAMPPISELAPTPLMPAVVQVSPMAGSIPPDSEPAEAATSWPSEPPSTPPESPPEEVPAPAEIAPAMTETAPDAQPHRRSVTPVQGKGPLPAPPQEFVMEAMMATAARVEKKRRRKAEQASGQALLGWARRALGNTVPADRAKDRTRGPLTPAAAELRLEEAHTGEEALSAFFAFARQYFEYSALFVVHGDLAAGHDAWGRGAGRDKVRTIGVALDLPNALSHARENATPVIAPLERAGLDAELRADLSRAAPRDVLVLPVLVLGRCVALLYADQGDEPVDSGEIGAVVAMAALLASTLERILLRKKRAMVRDSLRAKGVPEGEASRTSDPAGASDPEQLAPLPRKASARPTGGAFVKDESEAGGPELIVGEADERSLQVLLREMGGEDPASVSLGDRIPGSPSFGANGAELHEDGEPFDPLASASVSASPHPPPMSRTPHHELPRVLIRSDLVDLVIAGGERGEKALGEILALGETAIPSVFARFPGPLTVDRNQAIGDLPRPADCGPVLRIVAAMRRLALPFLAVRSADADVEVRFWATYLLGELNYADVAAALVPRLFDENTSVRRIAVRAARTLAAAGDQGVPLRKSLERTVAYADEPEARRLIALWTIGELRLYRSIPTLIAALSDPLDSIVEAALRSLAAMTRQEFGRDPKEWSEWWETKGKKRLP